MNSIAGMLCEEARFDKRGKPENSVVWPHAVTDLFVISHGWNTNRQEAFTLYRRFFESFVAVAGDLQGRVFGIVAVIWPSKRFDEQLAVTTPIDDVGGATSFGASDAPSFQALLAKLERMKQLFVESSEHEIIERLKELLPELEERATARREFMDKVRLLFDPSAAGHEDASEIFLSQDGNDLMNELKIDDEDVDEDIEAGTGGALLPEPFDAAGTTGGAAGFKQFLAGFKAAAMNVLNYTTYFEMKARAGRVGEHGLAKLIDELAPRVQRLHLIGHSFGARAMAAAAAHSHNTKIKTMTLLQAAFSHNSFSRSMNGFFRTVVDLRRVHGPVLISHTKNDKAVGIAYPLASRISGEKTAALGDENDPYGALGRNGAQKMEPGEAVKGALLSVGARYDFTAGQFLNLEGSAFIAGHGDIGGREVAHAVRSAVA